MTVKEFIEVAMEGGWRELNMLSFGSKKEKVVFEIIDCFGDHGQIWKLKKPFSPDYYFHTEQVFLDPKAWEAVGKVKGWSMRKSSAWSNIDFTPENINWTESEFKMHGMIEFLINGKTLEEYIATL